MRSELGTEGFDGQGQVLHQGHVEGGVLFGDHVDEDIILIFVPGGHDLVEEIRLLIGAELGNAGFLLESFPELVIDDLVLCLFGFELVDQTGVGVHRGDKDHAEEADSTGSYSKDDEDDDKSNADFS